MATNGLVLIKPSTVAKTGASSTATINAGGSVTFSLCETLSLNGVFSSAYDNYIVDMRFVASTQIDVLFRMRLAGSDNSTANSYVSQSIAATSTTVSGARATNDRALLTAGTDVQRSGVQAFLYGPALAQPTAGRSVSVIGISSAYLLDYAFTHNQSTAYDGCTIYRGGGNTISGLVKVYGLVK